MSLTATMAHERRRSSSNAKEKFPEFEHSQSGSFLNVYDQHDGPAVTSRTPSPTKLNGAIRNERWHPRKENHLAWGDGQVNIAGSRGHGRQKSLSDAFRTIRNRRASVSENAHEIAEALKAPVSVKIVVCGHPGMRILCSDQGSRFFVSFGT